jgi:hypothetical protein
MSGNSSRERRRATYQSGVVHSAEEAAGLEREYWSRLTPQERLTASLEMVETFLAMGGGSGAQHRLDRTATGIRRR